MGCRGRTWTSPDRRAPTPMRATRAREPPATACARSSSWCRGSRRLAVSRPPLIEGRWLLPRPSGRLLRQGRCEAPPPQLPLDGLVVLTELAQAEGQLARAPTL